MTTTANGHGDAPLVEDQPGATLGWNVRALQETLGWTTRELQFRSRVWPNTLRPILDDKARTTYFKTLRWMAYGLGVDICDLFSVGEEHPTLPLRVAISLLKRPDNPFNVAHNAAIDDVLALIAERWPNQIASVWYEDAESEVTVA